LDGKRFEWSDGMIKCCNFAGSKEECKKINMVVSKDKIFKTIQNHKSKLSDFGVNRIGLFGSYVRNEQTPSKRSNL